MVMLIRFRGEVDPHAIDDESETVLHRVVGKKHIDCAIVILEDGGCK